jgi:hypothetical protein
MNHAPALQQLFVQGFVSIVALSAFCWLPFVLKVALEAIIKFVTAALEAVRKCVVDALGWGKKAQEEAEKDRRRQEEQAWERNNQRRQQDEARRQNTNAREREEAARKRQSEQEEAAARERARQQEERQRWYSSSQGKLSEPQALEILGLKAGANKQEIRAAYNRLMKLVHPDVGGSIFFCQAT